jgi:hypothetical protein
MSPSCPISQNRVDTNRVRIISSLVVLFSLLFAITELLPFIMIVLFDFLMRAMRKERWSPFGRIGDYLLTLRQTEPHYTDEAPKRFALFLGLGITATILLLSFLGLMKTAVAVTLILIICAFLEVVFYFCIGCKLYYVLQLVKVMKHDRNFN